MGTLFEDEFTKFVETVLREMVQREVQAQIEKLRDPWVNVKEAAAIMRCSTRTVRRFLATGQLTVSTPGGAGGSARVLIERTSIDRLIQAASTPHRSWQAWDTKPRFRSYTVDPQASKNGMKGYQRGRLRKEGLSEPEIDKELERMGLL